MPLYQQLEYDSLFLPQLSIFHALTGLAGFVTLKEREVHLPFDETCSLSTGSWLNPATEI